MSSLEEALTEIYQAKTWDNQFAIESESERRRFMKRLRLGLKQRILDLSFWQCKMNVLGKIPKMVRLFPRIRSLNLYNNMIKDTGLPRVYHILHSEPQIVVLDIGANELTDDSYMRMIDIIKNTEIESLQMGRRGDPSAQDNKYSTDILTSIIKAVSERGKLRCFGISGTPMFRQKVSKQIAPYLAEMLDACPDMETLDLSSCGLIDSDQLVLSKALIAHANLLSLSIANNPFKRSWRIFDAICYLDRLRSLDISGCGVCEENLRILSHRFDHGWEIIHLNLSHNPIGDGGISELLTILCDNDTVCELYLSDTGITSYVADDIREYLMKTQSLYDIDISNNAFGDEIALAVADVLPMQETLTILSLEGCRITGDGGIAIFRALSENTTLTKLNMRDNFLSDRGFDILEDLKLNETLRVVDLASNQIDCFAMDAVESLMKRNKKNARDSCFSDLKRDYLRLKMQKARIPLLAAKLESLHAREGEIGEEINEIESRTSVFESDSNYDLVSIKHQMQEYEKMTETERKELKDTEFLIQDCRKAADQNIAEIHSKTFLEKSVFERTDAQVRQIEDDTQKMIEENKPLEDHIRGEIEMVQQMIKEISAALQSEKKLRTYEIPEYPFSDELSLNIDSDPELELSPVKPLMEVPKKVKRKLRKPSPSRRKRTPKKKLK